MGPDHKLENMEFSFDWALAQVPRELVEFPSLEVTQKHLDMVLGNLLSRGWIRWAPEASPNLSHSVTVPETFGCAQQKSVLNSTWKHKESIQV